jgi:hypothetical protein
MLFRETVGVYCENHTEHTNSLFVQNAELQLLKQVVHIITIVLYGVNDMSTLNIVDYVDYFSG